MEEFSRIALFAGLDREAARALAARCAFRRFAANELIIDYDEPSAEVRFILSGRVRLLLRTPDGKEVILAELGPDTYFGEMAAIDSSRRSANVTALEPTSMCPRPAAVFNETLAKYPDIAASVLKLLCARIRTLNIRLSDHIFLTTRQRLASELLRLSRPRFNRPGERIISPPPMHKLLADRIGTQREVITRELSRLRKKNIIAKSTGGLIVLEPDRLNAEITS